MDYLEIFIFNMIGIVCSMEILRCVLDEENILKSNS